MILDHFLGTETDTLLTNNQVRAVSSFAHHLELIGFQQMRQLIQIHSEEGIIDGDENQLLLAALTHHDRIATDIMTKNDRIFKISISAPTTYYLFDIAVFSIVVLDPFLYPQPSCSYYNSTSGITPAWILASSDI